MVAVVGWTEAANGGHDGELRLLPPRVRWEPAGYNDLQALWRGGYLGQYEDGSEGARRVAPPNSHDLDATATQEVVAPPTVEPLRAATPPLVVDGLEDAREQMPKLVPGTSIEALICSYSWPCEQALRIAMCESTMGQNPDAYADWNPSVHRPIGR